MESVRTFEEAEIALLLHARAKDPVVQRELESRLRERLELANQFVTTSEEAGVLREANKHVERYLIWSRSGEPFAGDAAVHEARAFDALGNLVAINIRQARQANQRAMELDRFANTAGVTLGASIVVITIGLVIWFRRRVFRPLFGLVDTMQRFGRGERSARAAERGPAELQEMSARFNEMADALAAQRQHQNAFLGGVAHDLRTPLSSLKLAVEMVGPNEPLPPEPQLRNVLGIIGRQIGRLEHMVGDLLDLSRMEAGELEIRIEERDLRPIVRDSVELFAVARGRLQVTMPETPVIVACDPGRIGQVVTNLVSNAVKYSPEDQPITVTLAAHDHDVTIAVSDRGVGIPRDDHHRIFEPFRRGLAKDAVPGAGLGLYNVQRIVEAHGGRIEVESVPAVGSTFRIRLPRSAAVMRSRPMHFARTT